LFESTETRYAEIAREMLSGGNWLIPHLDGIQHFHKPPLAYWAAAAGMAVFGVNAWGARIPVALASLVSLACVARLVARRFASLAVPPSRVVWVTGSAVLFAALGRALAADPFLTAAVLLYWALAPSPWALAAIGLGFFAKGPVVFIHTALPVLVAAAWGRDRRTLALLGPARGWLLFALVALPWYVIVAARTPGLVSYLLGNQLWGRYATTVHERGGPPWYFAAVLLAGIAPWTVALIAGGVRTWRERANPEARLALAWLIAPLVFLSFSGSKLPAYALPSFAAAGLIAARGLEGRAWRWGTAALLGAAIAAALMLGGPALARLAGVADPSAFGLPRGALAACALLALATLAALRGRAETCAALVAIAVAVFGLALARYDAHLGSPQRIAQILRENRATAEPVVEVGHFNAGLPFYLGETVRLMEVPREIGFESGAALAAVEVTPDSLAPLLARHRRVWTFGREARIEEIAREQGLRYVRLATWRKEALGFVTAAR
jgi:4-amino-4-deoxy-L-arabinose transferase